MAPLQSKMLYNQCFSTPLGLSSAPGSGKLSPVHSLILSTHSSSVCLFYILHPCRIVLERPVDLKPLQIMCSFMLPNGLLDDVTDFLVGRMVCIWNVRDVAIAMCFQPVTGGGPLGHGNPLA